MCVIPSFLSAELARTDLSRLQRNLFDLQRQTASGAKADDVKGYGGDAAQLLTTRTLLARAAARSETASNIIPRIEAQDAALDHAADAAETLRQTISTAISTSDGRFVKQSLELALSQIVGALHQTHDGEPLFAGDRTSGQGPILVTDLATLGFTDIAGATFSEAARDRTVDAGFGTIAVSERASTFAANLFNALRAVNAAAGDGSLGAVLTTEQRNALQAASAQLETGRADVVAAQGRNGALANRLDREVTALEARSNVLTRTLGDYADADLADVAARLSATQTQYQAAAQVFSQIKELSLVNFLS